MGSFEEGFADVERTADGTARAAEGLFKAARQLRRAAQEGDIAAVRRAAGRLEELASGVRQEVSNTQAAWPFSEETEESYMRDEYRAELMRAAAATQLSVSEIDGRILAFPSIVRIQPGTGPYGSTASEFQEFGRPASCGC
jgi:hypothetical protein